MPEIRGYQNGIQLGILMKHRSYDDDSCCMSPMFACDADSIQNGAPPPSPLTHLSDSSPLIVHFSSSLCLSLTISRFNHSYTNTMKLAVAALLAGSAAAFAPAQQGKSTTALNVNELEIGVTAPL